EAIGEPVEAVFPALDEVTRKSVENPVQALLRGEPSRLHGADTILVGRHGTEIPVDHSAAPIRDAEGQPSGVVLVFRDTSDRKASRQMQAQFADVVESSDDAILTHNLAGIITSWNAGAVILYGHEPNEVIGRPIQIMTPPDRQAESISSIARLQRGERIEH